MILLFRKMITRKKNYNAIFRNDNVILKKDNAILTFSSLLFQVDILKKQL